MASRIWMTSASVKSLTRRSGGIPTFSVMSLANFGPIPWIYCSAITTRLLVGILTPAMRATSALLHSGPQHLGAVSITTRDRSPTPHPSEEPNPAQEISETDAVLLADFAGVNRR